jgi:hypothetical protein
MMGKGKCLLYENTSALSVSYAPGTDKFCPSLSMAFRKDRTLLGAKWRPLLAVYVRSLYKVHLILELFQELITDAINAALVTAKKFQRYLAKRRMNL